ncbi:MAG: hypothetical protein A2539_03595 [Elusimicrobia bacterium RIFOXYD2_FULL_34_15]|nr:MAG: hypothetical protein A2539_03595 [Elusimicrobia bacterium RIFOXYD2_FULL_34_15]
MNYETFLKLVSDFLDDDDDDMELDFFENSHETLEDEFAYHFFNTLRRTIELCHQIEMERVPKTLHYNIIRAIEHTTPIGIHLAPKRKVLTKKHTKKLSKKIVKHVK